MLELASGQGPNTRGCLKPGSRLYGHGAFIDGTCATVAWIPAKDLRGRTSRTGLGEGEGPGSGQNQSMGVWGGHSEAKGAGRSEWLGGQTQGTFPAVGFCTR